MRSACTRAQETLLARRMARRHEDAHVLWDNCTLSKLNLDPIVFPNSFVVLQVTPTTGLGW